MNGQLPSAPPTAGAPVRVEPMVGGTRTPSAPSIAGTPAAEVLRRLELAVTRSLEGLLQGDHRGLTPGHGSEPGEIRAYQPGDDVRRIDWNVTARSVEPHIRDTIADRELETWVLVDTSASLAFGTARCEKRDLVLAAVAATGHLTARTGNRFGAVGLVPGERQPLPVPARSGRVHVQAVLRRLLDDLAAPQRGHTDLAAGIRRLGGLARRRGLAVVISDFLDDSGWHLPLRALALRHDVLCVDVVDPVELALPDAGTLTLHDPESGAEMEIRSGDADLRARYAAAAAEQRAGIAARIRAAGADHLTLRTDGDWLLDLARFVGGRRDRIDALSRASAHGSGPVDRIAGAHLTTGAAR